MLSHTVCSHIVMLLITPSAVMSSHLFAVMSVISVSPVIFLTHWVRYRVWWLDDILWHNRAL